MSMNPRKFSAEDQNCTGCCFWSFSQPYVLTCGSWTVPTGVVHQVPRSSIRTVSPWPRALKARAIGSAVIVPPKPEPTTTTEWYSSTGVIRAPPSPLADDAIRTPAGRACQATCPRRAGPRCAVEELDDLLVSALTPRGAAFIAARIDVSPSTTPGGHFRV